MRVNLSVPISDIDVAKARGARWDIARKVWFINDAEDFQQFAQWMDPEVQDWFKGRIDLEVGFADNAKVKAMGAKWDPIKRVWYTYQKPKLFAKWIKGSKKTVKKESKPVTTKPEGGFKPLCNCTTPPWEDCIHTDAQTQAILASEYGISSSANHNG